MNNQMSSTPKRMLGCVILGVFGFLFLFSCFLETGSIMTALLFCGVLIAVVLLCGLLVYCFD